MKRCKDCNSHQKIASGYGGDTCYKKLLNVGLKAETCSAYRRKWWKFWRSR